MKYFVESMTNSAVRSRAIAASLVAIQDEEKKIKNLDKDADDDSWKKVSGSFVGSDDSLSFIRYLESLGDNTGADVSLTSVDNIAPVDGDLANNGYVSTKISVRGSWQAVVKTLMLSENMPYKVMIDNVQLTKVNDGKSKESALWSLNFDLSAVKLIQ
ncbi:MAG: hypothetical protein WCK03_00560 [Candidatus Taylorbacteria bacterium]